MHSFDRLLSRAFAHFEMQACDRLRHAETLSEILSGNLSVDGGMRSPNIGGCAVRTRDHLALGFPQGLGSAGRVMG